MIKREETKQTPKNEAPKLDFDQKTLKEIDDVLTLTKKNSGNSRLSIDDFSRTLSLFDKTLNEKFRESFGKSHQMQNYNALKTEMDIHVIKLIGCGASSEVYQCREEKTNKEYALRLTRIDEVETTYERAMKEIKINSQLALLENPNIVRAYQQSIVTLASNSLIKEYDLFLQIVMDLGICTLEDIYDVRVREARHWKELELMKITYDLALALAEASKIGINHRDISLNNVVLMQDLTTLKIVDFGEAKIMSDKVEDLPLVGKYQYLAPEVNELMENIRNHKFDLIKQSIYYDVRSIPAKF